MSEEEIAQWAKKTSRSLFSDVESWVDDKDPVYEKENVWPVKKLLIVDLYIPRFYQIATKVIPKIAFVDFFCGSGLMRFGGRDLCKGTALIPLFVADKYPFSEYRFFDLNPKYVKILSKRIARVRKERQINGKSAINEPECMSFSASSELLYGEKGLLRKAPLALVIIDPEGYSEVPWRDVERILLNGFVDVVMTFMTSGIFRGIRKAQERPNGEDAKTLDSFFGGRVWMNLKSGDEALELYCNKFRSLKYHVRTISVNEKGERRLYDMILASKKQFIVDNIFEHIARRLGDLTSERLATQIKINQGRQSELTGFMDPKAASE